jgi:hypothetical protein
MRKISRRISRRTMEPEYLTTMTLPTAAARKNFPRIKRGETVVKRRKADLLMEIHKKNYGK